MEQEKPRAAVLFDIDGTLIDSNYLQVDAWLQAFAAAGQPVDAARIHRAIALDSSRMLAMLLGERAEELGDLAKKLHTGCYEQLASRLRPFKGARQLLATVAGHGVAVVLATSAPEKELKLLRAALDAEDHLTAVTSADDADTAKPAPDLLQVALTKVDVAADRAVMVGDTVWDGKACAAAGVGFIGLLSGGISSAELRAAGAIAVYDDPADLLDHLDDSPLGALWV